MLAAELLYFHTRTCLSRCRACPACAPCTSSSCCRSTVSVWKYIYIVWKYSRYIYVCLVQVPLVARQPFLCFPFLFVFVCVCLCVCLFCLFACMFMFCVWESRVYVYTTETCGKTCKMLCCPPGSSLYFHTRTCSWKGVVITVMRKRRTKYSTMSPIEM